MRNAFYTLTAAALAICITSVAFAQSYERYVSPYDWRAMTPRRGGAWQQPCGDFTEGQHGYINSCGELIPSQNDPEGRPGTG
jgi:hypothetical protein